MGVAWRWLSARFQRLRAAVRGLWGADVLRCRAFRPVAVSRQQIATTAAPILAELEAMILSRPDDALPLQSRVGMA